jgi:glycosyltransferase involved in cell wall biosynthesis
VNESAEQPRVSAVIPSYNHEHYVAGTVESVLAQDFDQPFEVVIVDDGSSDGSPEILRGFAEADPRVRLDVRENQGISATFQRCLELARAPWVAFCCSDDCWAPNHLQASWDNLQDHPEAVLSFGRARIVDAEGAERPDEQVFGTITDPDPTEPLLRYGNSLCFISALIKRELALEVGGFDPGNGVLQDYDLYLRMLQHGRATYLTEPTVDFRWDGENASGPKASTQRRRDLVRVLERCLGELPRLQEDTPLRQAVLKRLRRTHVRLARRLPRGQERRGHLAEARKLGLSGWQYGLELLRGLV